MSPGFAELAPPKISFNVGAVSGTRPSRRDKLAWDMEIEEDFSPGGKHEKTLERIDAQIDAGNFTALP